MRNFVSYTPSRILLCAHRYGRSFWESSSVILSGTIGTSAKGLQPKTMKFKNMFPSQHLSVLCLHDFVTRPLRLQECTIYTEFRHFVRDAALIRLVNALVWRCEEIKVVLYSFPYQSKTD